jgi:hypothetical protein
MRNLVCGGRSEAVSDGGVVDLTVAQFGRRCDGCGTGGSGFEQRVSPVPWAEHGGLGLLRRKRENRSVLRDMGCFGRLNEHRIG